MLLEKDIEKKKEAKKRRTKKGKKLSGKLHLTRTLLILTILFNIDSEESAETEPQADEDVCHECGVLYDDDDR